MSSSIQIKAPQGYLTGFPVQIIIPNADLKEKPIVLVKGQDQNLNYKVALRTELSSYEGELLFSVPGTYEISVGDFRETIVVKQSEILDFGTEFGIFSTSVCLLLILMLVWLKRKKATQIKVIKAEG